MESLNKKERKKAFWKFLGFFIVTFLFLMGAVFINFNLPVKENVTLKAKHAKVKKELEFQTKFSKKMHTVEVTLDTINQSGQQAMYLDQVVRTKLAGLKESISQQASLQQGQLYDYIIKIALSLQEAKSKLRNLEKSQQLIPTYEKRLQSYKDALDQTERDLDICRQLSQ